eukprot:GGOE01002674.1.p1 GENE.GGOE01002674.1~~GGOE01002674.1.p1  ORF type:complete len:307 (+),score=65.20 GGOE01002674.1:47-922(+)
MAQPLTPEESKHLAKLQAKFPTSPEEELLRFCRARPKSSSDAIKMYSEYLKWRSGPGSPESLAQSAAVVPSEWVRQCGVARDGTIAAYCQGARYDPAIEPERYVHCCAHLIDQAVNADDLKRITILIDTRGGPGWPNPSPKAMVGFFRLASQVLNANYPERAQRLIIYPIPSALVSMWNIFSFMLDSVTRNKFIMLSSDGGHCPPKLFDYIALDQFPPDAQPLHRVLGGNTVTPASAASNPTEGTCQHTTSTSEASLSLSSSTPPIDASRGGGDAIGFRRKRKQICCPSSM